MKRSRILRRLAAILVASSVCVPSVFAQSVDPAKTVPLPEGFAADLAPGAVHDQRVRQYLLPKRVVWTSETGVKNAELLLKPVLGQTSTSIMGDETQGCVLSKGGSILLDFGAEIHGSFRI